MKRFRPPSRRSLLEITLALVAGLFAVLAAIWPNWIEAFGADPDGGDGSLEWAIPIVLVAAALVLGFVARRHWRIDAAKTIGT
jgi:membrane protease YdiL (CAAX protease family)